MSPATFVGDSPDIEISYQFLNDRISLAVDSMFRIDTFRSSISLKNALKSSVETQVVPYLKDSRSQASFNTRVGALMKLSVSFLCMPRISTLLGFGLIPAQDEGHEISKRLKGFVAEMLCILLQGERFHPNEGQSTSIATSSTSVIVNKILIHQISTDDSSLDCRRIELLIDLVLLRRSLLIPFVITMTESCPEALMHMSCHMLVVSALADEILETISIVTRKIRTQLNKDLSLTTNSTKEILRSEFTHYFAWLRSHYEGLRKICRNNEIFSGVDKSVKAWLKGEEYESPAHLLVCYNQKYRKYLTNMNIPLQAFRMEDVQQATKDIRRDVVVLNDEKFSFHEGVSRRSGTRNDSRDRRDSSSIDTTENGINRNEVNDATNKVANGNDSSEVRNECLAYAVVEEICISLAAKSSIRMKFSVKANEDNSFSVKSYPPKVLLEKEKNDQDIAKFVVSNLEDDSSLEFEAIATDTVIGSDATHVSTSSYVEVDHVSEETLESLSVCEMSVVVWNSDETLSISEYSNSPSDGGSPVGLCSDNGVDPSQITLQSTALDDISKARDSILLTNSIKLHENLLEMLLNQVLLAASRTTAGGDAFFILENLYGGEGLLFSPRSYRTQMPKQKASTEKHKDEGIFGNFLSMYGGTGGIAEGKTIDDDNSQIKEKSYSGIAINISEGGICVVLKEQYNLLLKESLEQNMELSLPLISFECTTTTRIDFPSHANTNRTYELYCKLLYNTEKICQRTICIEPFMSK